VVEVVDLAAHREAIVKANTESGMAVVRDLIEHIVATEPDAQRVVFTLYVACCCLLVRRHGWPIELLQAELARHAAADPE
jgi:hypothetical protein